MSGLYQSLYSILAPIVVLGLPVLIFCGISALVLGAAWLCGVWRD